MFTFNNFDFVTTDATKKYAASIMNGCNLLAPATASKVLETASTIAHNLVARTQSTDTGDLAQSPISELVIRWHGVNEHGTIIGKPDEIVPALLFSDVLTTPDEDEAGDLSRPLFAHDMSAKITNDQGKTLGENLSALELIGVFTVLPELVHMFNALHVEDAEHKADAAATACAMLDAIRKKECASSLFDLYPTAHEFFPQGWRTYRENKQHKQAMQLLNILLILEHYDHRYRIETMRTGEHIKNAHGRLSIDHPPIVDAVLRATGGNISIYATHKADCIPGATSDRHIWLTLDADDAYTAITRFTYWWQLRSLDRRIDMHYAWRLDAKTKDDIYGVLETLSPTVHNNNDAAVDIAGAFIAYHVDEAFEKVHNDDQTFTVKAPDFHDAIITTTSANFEFGGLCTLLGDCNLVTIADDFDTLHNAPIAITQDTKVDVYAGDYCVVEDAQFIPLVLGYVLATYVLADMEKHAHMSLADMKRADDVTRQKGIDDIYYYDDLQRQKLMYLQQLQGMTYVTRKSTAQHINTVNLAHLHGGYVDHIRLALDMYRYLYSNIGESGMFQVTTKTSINNTNRRYTNVIAKEEFYTERTPATALADIDFDVLDHPKLSVQYPIYNAPSDTDYHAVDVDIFTRICARLEHFVPTIMQPLYRYDLDTGISVPHRYAITDAPKDVIACKPFASIIATYRTKESTGALVPEEHVIMHRLDYEQVANMHDLSSLPLADGWYIKDKMRPVVVEIDARHFDIDEVCDYAVDINTV